MSSTPPPPAPNKLSSKEEPENHFIAHLSPAAVTHTHTFPCGQKQKQQQPAGTSNQPLSTAILDLVLLGFWVRLSPVPPQCSHLNQLEGETTIS